MLDNRGKRKPKFFPMNEKSEFLRQKPKEKSFHQKERRSNNESDFVATTLAGLEEVLAVELKNLGAKNIHIKKRAVGFNGDKALIYKANLHLRTALRVLKPIYHFKADNEKKLYDAIVNFEWEKILNVDNTFAIDASVHSEYFKHSKYAALKTKDGIADYFRNKYGKRPSVDVDNPTVRFNLHISRESCSILLDSSGEPLYKRGYRLEQVQAPLNEVLAAGLILISGWKGDSDFVDPMCGSGTIPIEASLIASNTAPGMTRKKFGFMTWDDFDSELWDKVVGDAIEKEVEPNCSIFASDMDNRNLEIAKANAARAGVSDFIKFKNSAIENLSPFENGGVAIINPPYGERLKIDELDKFYKMIGDSLKQNFTNFDVWIISSNKEGMKRVGLKTSKKLTLYNGPLESKFHKYEMYRGTKKQIHNS